MPNHNTISVIICAYTEQRWPDLLEAVDSVQMQTIRPMEIIVVIDHNDDLYERAKHHISQVDVIKNSLQRGLSGARNSGIAAADGDIIVFMDEDAAAQPDWLARLKAHYDDTAVLGVGGQIISAWEKGRPNWFPPEFDWVVGCTYRGMPESAAPVRNLIGCNMSFRRELFDEIGGFRDGMGRLGTFPAGCEETELCIRAGQKWPARKLLYEPAAKVRHRVPAVRGRWRYFRARCYAEGMSKALVTNFVGAQDGLASERHYTFRTLPSGVLAGLTDSFRKGKPGGLGRAAAIVLGLGLTTFGYLVGKMKMNGRFLIPGRQRVASVFRKYA